MLTLEDALLHLGYDVPDATITKTVEGNLAEAKAYLKGAVGEDVLDLLPNDERVDILLKAYLDDLHDDRGTTSAKANNAKRAMIHSAETQLRLKLVRERAKAEGATV